MAVVAEAADPRLADGRPLAFGQDRRGDPGGPRAPEEGWGFAVYPFAEAARGFRHMPRSARGDPRPREARPCLPRRGTARASSRTIRPLQMEYWGRVWTLTAWCETRADFRSFRVDRIEDAPRATRTLRRRTRQVARRLPRQHSRKPRNRFISGQIPPPEAPAHAARVRRAECQKTCGEAAQSGRRGLHRKDEAPVAPDHQPQRRAGLRQEHRRAPMAVSIATRRSPSRNPPGFRAP